MYNFMLIYFVANSQLTFPVNKVWICCNALWHSFCNENCVSLLHNSRCFMLALSFRASA